LSTRIWVLRIWRRWTPRSWVWLSEIRSKPPQSATMSIRSVFSITKDIQPSNSDLSYCQFLGSVQIVETW
jgi:hypothetical protein